MMRFIADLHIHSHFSRATARNLDPENLALWAKKKGITLIGTGDFTHPGWIAELQDKLIEAENGLYRLKPELERTIEKEIPPSCLMPTRFMLSGEISCIYKRAGKTRKIHHLILMPDFESVAALNQRLDRIGNIHSDGRPILGLDSRDLLEIVLDVCERSFFIPAHVWTPWFSLFGSKSGFDTIEECFDDMTAHVYALETGLSSDPPMNRLLSSLDTYLLVSNSDAHSPSKLGREGNLFHTDLDYDCIISAMKNGEGFEGTIEFFPEEGKYHYDGHRKCQICLDPADTRACGGVCPACRKTLTIGVLHRVVELADRDQPELSKAFRSLIPLTEILSELLACGPSTKKVTATYEALLSALGPELHILMDAPLPEIESVGGPLLSKAIERMRQGRVIKQEGYDGEYGVIRLFHETEISELAGQIALFGPSKKGLTEKSKTATLGPSAFNIQRTRSDARQMVLLDSILDLLNPDQKEAVLYQGGHLLIIAGPGTGKTMTLTHRIAYMMRSGQATPGDILALTFTNKAAGEMEERIGTLTPEGDDMHVSTFHRFCLEVLRHETDKADLSVDFALCAESDATLIAEQVITEQGKGKRTAAAFIKTLPALKSASVLSLKAPSLEPFVPAFRRYQERLRRLGMLDLDDIEVETLRLFRNCPEVCRAYAEKYHNIFVDEYQDTNPIQTALLKSLVEAGKGVICAIGDPDQAIYGFRGAEVRNFHAFKDDFPGAREIRLTENYRSTQSILDGAARLMAKEAPLQGHNGLGAPIAVASCRTMAEEAEMIVEQIERVMGGTTYFSLDSGRVASHEEGEDLSFGDVAVLFRLNAQGDALEEALSRAGIPYVRSGEKPLIERYPVNVLWRFFQTLQYPEKGYYRNAYLDHPEMKDVDGRNILNDCEIGLPLPELIDRAAALHEFDLSNEASAEALRRIKGIAHHFAGDLSSFLDTLSLDRAIDHATLIGDRVALMSLHAAKGLEWPVVFITGCEDKLLPCTLFGDRDDKEEKRLFYVGMTRARQRLVLSHASHRTLNGRPLEMKPSPFLDLLPRDLCAPLERTHWKPKKSAHKQLTLFG